MILTCADVLAKTSDGQLASGDFTVGDAVEMALALAHLDQPVGLFGALSQDAVSRQIEQSLVHAGVDLSRAPKASGTSIDSPPHKLSPLHLPDLNGITALTFGGPSLVRRESAGVYEALMHLAGVDKTTVLNLTPPQDVPNEHQSDYQKRLSRMTEMADIIIQPPIDGTPFPHRSHETLLCGRASIVIQLHSKGRVSVSSRNGTFSVNTPSKPEISPSRLGNVFVAGFLAALSQNDGLIPRALAMTHSKTLSTAAEFGIKAAQTFPDMGSQLHDIKQDLS